MITDFQRDELKEVVNIGAGNACTALSKMLGKKIGFASPNVFVDQAEKVWPLLGNAEDVVSVVLLKIVGDVSGVIVIVLPAKDAIVAARVLTDNHRKYFDFLDDFDRSALKESGNILSGASLSALSKFLDMNILQSVPEVATDMLGAVMGSIMVDVNSKEEYILVFNIDLDIESVAKGKLFFMFDPKASEKILEATQKKML
jgi:chemotaxis protein CheC